METLSCFLITMCCNKQTENEEVALDQGHDNTTFTV
jgi:hypothetical protein